MAPVEVKKVGFRDLAPYVRLVQHIRDDDKYRVPTRIIYDNEIILVVDGDCDYLVEGKETRLLPGDLLFMPPHVEHSCQVRPGGRFHYYAVHFDWVYLGESHDFSVDDIYLSNDYRQAPFIPLEEELTGRPVVELDDFQFPLVLKTAVRHEYERILAAMFATYSSNYFGSIVELRADMLKILGLAVRESVNERGLRRSHPDAERINRVFDWVGVHFAQPLTSQDLAAVANLSSGHFRVLFKEATGRAPLEFLAGVRMDRARVLLRKGGLSIGQVAEAVGYPDIHYFSRLFKKMEGISPKKFSDSLAKSFDVNR
jgi:AraC-like DNA-binding protein